MELPAADSPGELNAGFGAFLAGAGGFDAAAFQVSPAEAVLMDPQQRIALQTFAEAFHSAQVGKNAALPSQCVKLNKGPAD